MMMMIAVMVFDKLVKSHGYISLVGNVGDMSGTCRPDMILSANFALIPKCCRCRD